MADSGLLVITHLNALLFRLSSNNNSISSYDKGKRTSTAVQVINRTKCLTVSCCTLVPGARTAGVVSGFFRVHIHTASLTQNCNSALSANTWR